MTEDPGETIGTSKAFVWQDCGMTMVQCSPFAPYFSANTSFAASTVLQWIVTVSSSLRA